ncbi:hypothetical protein ACWGKW_22850 [Streptomyces sp. NPDC054766]
MTSPAPHRPPTPVAERAAPALATLPDPAARISAPMRRRTNRLRTDRLRTRTQDLLTAAARPAPGGPLDEALRQLRQKAGVDFVFPAGCEDGYQVQQAAQQAPHDLLRMIGESG